MNMSDRLDRLVANMPDDDDSNCTIGSPIERRHRVKMMEDALLAIATMDVYTREKEKPAHEVMRDVARTALIGIQLLDA
jgi:hypothetical protein